ncbi:glycosyltransferase [Cerasicoccus fimbriatus]|uniref:glycosyltransferase n=1 Tax=Cerasicoccus fimbriatus TaxID=3014554 RepID=UPI0022B40DAF|nr:glycosyltransferase [Cerasicoccus sp. TK19100]
MKALFINHTRTGGGGATIAAERLADGLRTLNIDVNWLIKTAPDQVRLDDYQVVSSPTIDRLLERPLKDRMTIGAGRLSTFSQISGEFAQQADVIHMHNLHPAYFNFLALPKLCNAKPVVWTLHDMWPFTGHCAFSMDCGRWQTGCGACPHLGVYPGVKHDWTAIEWKLKRWSLSRARLHIITPSQWLADCVQKSIAKHIPVSVLPYGINTNTYAPADQNHARQALGIEASRIVFLLSSANLDDPRKPQTIICDALNRLSDELMAQIQVITFGGGDIRPKLNQQIPVKALGLLTSDDAKVQAYRAADALLFASRADNLPLTIQESLACGTPVIANPVGGVTEMVINNRTGLLTDDLSAEAYQRKIENFIGTRKEERIELKQHARDHAEAHFDLSKHARQTIEIYREMMN